MNELQVIDNKKIESMIYEVRGKQVMLDSDLANLFEYSTKDLNRNVKNNGQATADTYSARPGYSEHELGTVIDVSNVWYIEEGDDEYKWIVDEER